MANKKKQYGRLSILIAVLVTCVVVPISFMIMSAMGEKSGVEFSPDDFSMRKFDYCRLPLFNWTLRGIEYEDIPNEFAQTLIADDWVRVTGRTPKRWHLVSENGSGGTTSLSPSAECDARFLTKYFDMTTKDAESLVMKWTEDHPKPAKAFWALIAEMARDSLYLPIPELMEFALEYHINNNTDVFIADLEQKVANAWFEAASSDQLNGKHQLAISRFETAIRIGGDNPQAENAKAKSQTAISDGEDPSL